MTSPWVDLLQFLCVALIVFGLSTIANAPHGDE